jgi:hypothetical protein
MRWYLKVFVGTITATALVASLASSATARNFSISNRNIRTVFAPLQFASPGANFTISCNVTLEGTFHANTIAKVVNSLIGYITRGTFDTPNCRESGGGVGRASIQTPLPWHIRYTGFIGTLPSVRVRLQLIHATFRILGLPFGLSCDYLASPFLIVEGPGLGDPITAGNAFLRAEEAQGFSSLTSPFCAQVSFVGRGAVTLLGTTTPITVRLI